MIHGKTKIELYNPNTKIKNIIKSENTFQSNVLADYFRHFGELGCDAFDSGYYDGTNLWKNALGGIFLLKNPETVGNKFMSLGNVMVGNGSYGLSNSGSPNELGSYNSQESSESGTEITQVYDFATNQANGNIGCVCLTSRVGGYIGYGNKGGQSHSSNNYAFNSLQSYRNVLDFTVGSAYQNYLVEPLGDYSDGKLRIKLTRASLITGSAFNGFSKNLEFDLIEVGDAYNMSGQVLNYGCDKVFDIGNGIFRFIPAVSGGKTVAPSGTVYYYEFDAVNETLTQKSFTNSSSNSLIVSNYNWVEVNHVVFNDKYAFCHTGEPTQGNGYIVEVFDITTSEHIDTINAHNFDQYGDIRRHQTVVLDNGWIAFDLRAGYNSFFMYDAVNKTMYKINAGSSSIGLVANPSVGAGMLERIKSSYSSSANVKGMIHNPLYLATINNLDSYVTKTANQTMKVTYTLTEE